MNRWFTQHKGLLIFCLVALGVVLAVAVIRAVLARRSGGPKGGKKNDGQAPAGEERPPKETLDPYALYAEKGRLEQRMAYYAGGKTGVVMLLHMIRSAPDSQTEDDAKRVSFRMKQEGLRQTVERYNELLKKAEGLPPEERARFVPTDSLEQYLELLRETV